MSLQLSNSNLDSRKEGDKILTMMPYLLLKKLNKNRNSVMYYSKSSLPKADNIGKMKRVGDESVSLSFIYSVSSEALGGPRI